jgi:F0F1-type ATP synthase assembly protein I
MPFNSPIPEKDAQTDSQSADDLRGKDRGGLATLVQAERLMQIALVLPCALVIGWGAGWWIDSQLHTHWATIVGVILGMAAGMVSAVRMALDAGKSAKPTGEKSGK